MRLSTILLIILAIIILFSIVGLILNIVWAIFGFVWSLVFGPVGIIALIILVIYLLKYGSPFRK